MRDTTILISKDLRARLIDLKFKTKSCSYDELLKKILDEFEVQEE